MQFVVQNLGKSYKEKWVVRDVSFKVNNGEIIGLLGANGAGKTTCFYMAVGLVAVDSGKVYLDGIDITNMPLHKRSRLGIAYLAQEASIFRGLNVEDNIMAILELHEPSEEKRQRKLTNLLNDFSIEHLRYSSSLSLSGGERRRLEIARALATNPRFIFLDEPFAGIDPVAIHDIKDIIMKVKERDIGIIITDHNVRETLSIVDRAYIINAGSILIEGKPQDIVDNQEVRSVYLGKNFTF